VNYWHQHSLYAGDRLIMRLVLVKGEERETTREFQLTSYYERPVTAPVTTTQSYWQLQPWILNMDPEQPVNRFDYRVKGYWHIAQSFQGRQSSGMRHRVPPGAPLQVTFAPVFVPNTCSEAVELEWYWNDLIGCFTRAELILVSNLMHNHVPAQSFGVFNEMCGNLRNSLEVKLVTIRKTVGRAIWENMDDVHRLICFGTITSLLHFAKETDSEYLTRRVLRRIVTLEKMTTTWGAKSNDAIEIEMDAFFQEVLGDRIDAFYDYTSGGDIARIRTNLDDARNGRNAVTDPISRWTFHGIQANAGEALAGLTGVVGSGMAGEAGEVGCSAEECVEAVRRPTKKKKGLAFVLPDARDAVGGDGVHGAQGAVGAAVGGAAQEAGSDMQ
jgi:hypothetical protein